MNSKARWGRHSNFPEVATGATNWPVGACPLETVREANGTMSPPMLDHTAHSQEEDSLAHNFQRQVAGCWAVADEKRAPPRHEDTPQRNRWEGDDSWHGEDHWMSVPPKDRDDSHGHTRPNEKKAAERRNERAASPRKASIEKGPNPHESDTAPPRKVYHNTWWLDPQGG